MPASPVHHTAIDKTSAWDGGAVEKSFDKKSTDFKLFYAWYDTGEVDPAADGTDKEDGWGPHHDVNAAGVPGAANLAGVHAAVAALNGAHGSNSRVPDADRQATFNHLIAHLKDAGVDAKDLPELKSVQPHKARARRELNQDGRETRYFTVHDLEIRSGDGVSSDVPAGLVEVLGTVIVYGVPYEVNDMWGSFQETIHYGSATDVLASDDLDVRFLFNHGDMPMARTGSPMCPLNLTEDQQGVHIRALLDPKMTNASDLLLAMDPEHRLVTQMSVGMQVDPDGDIWSGEDDYGLPNVRNIVRLENIFDSSAVTYPASPTTTVQTQRSRMAYEAARQVRAGRGTQAQAEQVMRMLERLEQRDDPTPQDGKVADQITKVGHAIADLKAAQAGDPDTNTDPQDKKVSAAIDALSDAHDAVVAAQAKDGNPDAPEAPETKDNGEGEGENTETPQGDPDGTLTDGAGNAPVPDNEDGTGSRAAELQAELKQRRAALDLTRRRLAVEKARLRV